MIRGLGRATGAPKRLQTSFLVTAVSGPSRVFDPYSSPSTPYRSARICVNTPAQGDDDLSLSPARFNAQPPPPPFYYNLWLTFFPTRMHPTHIVCARAPCLLLFIDFACFAGVATKKEVALSGAVIA
jgi:hypothetical protein